MVCSSDLLCRRDNSGRWQCLRGRLEHHRRADPRSRRLQYHRAVHHQLLHAGGNLGFGRLRGSPALGHVMRWRHRLARESARRVLHLVGEILPRLLIRQCGR